MWGSDSTCTDSRVVIKGNPHSQTSLSNTLCHFAHHLAYQKLRQETTIADLTPSTAMSPAQDSHQPTHAAQPAGALDFAPDEEPIAFSFDGEGPPLDSAFFDAWMEQPGFWDVDFASQSAFDPGLDGQAMMPSFDAGGELFDWTQNYWNDGTLGFGTGSASQSAPDFAFNEQAMLPSPFDGNPWMDQPLEIASQGAQSAIGPAPIATDGAQSYLQDASVDGLYPADWTYHGAGMPDALGRLADPVR